MEYGEGAYVVDDNDNVLTTKQRDEITPDERVRIVAIWVENSMGEILIAQRAKSMSLDPGLWGPSAAGGVKVGSSYEETALEELREEIGLEVSQSELNPKGKMVYETTKNGKRMCAVFSVNCNWPIAKFKTEPTEVESIQWIKKSVLLADIKNNPSKYLASAELWEQYIS